MVADIRGNGMYPVHNLDLCGDGTDKIAQRGEVDGTTTVAVNPHDGFMLGKRKRSPEQRREHIAKKRQRGEELTLDEKRSEEAEAVKAILKKHQTEMLQIKEWLERNFKDRTSSKPFIKLGGMFCDGIILPRLS